MNDLINLLQTLALVMTLILVIFVLGWIVYAFRKFVVLFNRLTDELDRPRVHVQTNTVSSVVANKPEIEIAQEEPAKIEIKRYPCKTCKARLPEEPTHSIVKDETNLLVYKCRRCGKETEVNPETASPAQPK